LNSLIIFEANRWKIRPPRHAPGASLEGHLTFALKYGGLDLTVLDKMKKSYKIRGIDYS